MQPIKTVYFISYAKLPGNTSAGKLLEYIGVGLYINYETGVVENASCTLLTQEAKEYIKLLIVGFNFHTQDINELVDRINFHYHGLSQKAIGVILKAVYEKYMNWRKETLTV